MPSMTRPKTVCLPLRSGAGRKQMKNWEPPEFGALVLAMLNEPRKC